VRRTSRAALHAVSIAVLPNPAGATTIVNARESAPSSILDSRGLATHADEWWGSGDEAAWAGCRFVRAAIGLPLPTSGTPRSSLAFDQRLSKNNIPE
jgi:hypothetical protein